MVTEVANDIEIESENPETFAEEANEIKNDLKNSIKEVKERIVVDTEKIKNEEDTPVEINVNQGGIGSLKKFVSKPTKEHQLAEDKKEETENVEDEALIGKYISEEEYQLIASVLIILIDTVIINIFKFWSGDTRDGSFGLSKPKRNELTGILAKILKKHNVKWSLELLFVFMLVLGYVQSAKNAYEFRKEQKEAKLNVKRVKVVDENGKEHEVSESEIAQDNRGRRLKKHTVKKQGKKIRETEELYDNAEAVD